MTNDMGNPLGGAGSFNLINLGRSQKKVLIEKQNNYKTQGNENLFLSTVCKFVYVIITLVFSSTIYQVLSHSWVP